VENVIALQPFEAGGDAGGDVVAGMADRQTSSGRIGKVVEDVLLRFVGIITGLIQINRLPKRPPPLFNSLKIIIFSHHNISKKINQPNKLINQTTKIGNKKGHDAGSIVAYIRKN
jgi:hypothetical protein